MSDETKSDAGVRNHPRTAAESPPKDASGTDNRLTVLADSISRTVEGERRHLRQLLVALNRAVDSLKRGQPPHIQRLTLASVVDYFVKHRPQVPEAVAAGISQEPTDAGIIVHLFFLDAEGSPIPAHTYLVQEFDEELTGTFAANNLIIFS